MGEARRGLSQASVPEGARSEAGRLGQPLEKRPSRDSPVDGYRPRVRRVLVTGMSGTGKSTALAELARRGFRVVDTDEPGWKEPRGGDEVWREDRMAALLAEDDGRALYVAGCVPNQGAFYDRFDAVVLLSAPADVILERIATRTANGFGKSPEERARVLTDLAETEPLLRATCTAELDASRPIDEVVDALVAVGCD